MTRSENILGTMPMGRLIFTMSGPIMLSMLMQAVYNLVDSIYVARLGDDAFLALSYAYPIQTLLIAFCVGTGVAFSAVLSQRLGAKQMDQASSVVLHGGLLYFLCGLIFFLFGLLGADAYLRTCTDTPSVIAQGTAYLQVCCCLSFGCFTQLMFERMLQATGKTVYTMITQTTGAVINIILDPILIFGLFGFPKMGITGAAAATVIGQMIAAVLAVFINQTKNKEVQIDLHHFRPDKNIIGQIYVIGVPSIVMQAIGSVMNYGMNRILIAFSSTATAVFGVYFKLQSFVFMPAFGLNNGVIPVMAYNYGAGSRERVVKTLRHTVTYAVCIMAVGLLIFQLFPTQLLKMFSASDTMLSLGVPALRIISLSFILAGFGISCSSIFQALGKAVYSMFVSIARQLVALLPVAYFLAQFGNVNLIWWAFPIAELISIIMTILFMFRIFRTIVNKIGEKEMA